MSLQQQKQLHQCLNLEVLRQEHPGHLHEQQLGQPQEPQLGVQEPKQLQLGHLQLEWKQLQLSCLKQLQLLHLPHDDPLKQLQLIPLEHLKHEVEQEQQLNDFKQLQLNPLGHFKHEEEQQLHDFKQLQLNGPQGRQLQLGHLQQLPHFNRLQEEHFGQ